jgi:hypothetical protein
MLIVHLDRNLQVTFELISCAIFILLDNLCLKVKKLKDIKVETTYPLLYFWSIKLNGLTFWRINSGEDKAPAAPLLQGPPEVRITETLVGSFGLDFVLPTAVGLI